MTTNEHGLDILTFSESHNNQNSKNLFKRTTLTKPGAHDENPGESLQTIPMVQVEEVLTYSNFPFSNKSQLSIQGTQEDLDKIFSLDKSNVHRTMQIYGGSQISQGSLTLNKDLSAPNLDPENVYARNNSRANTQTTNKKSYAQSLDISNIEEKSEFVVESFGDKISPDASDMKIILSPSKESPGPDTPGMRYGKMSEEAAAMAFEARRKQLLETLSKASDNKKVKKSPSASRKIVSTDAKRSPDQKSPIGNKTFANFEQKIGSVRKAALSKDYNVPPSPHFGRVPSDSSKAKVHQARTRDDVAHLISWTPKSTQQSNRRSNSKNSNRSSTNLSNSFRDPEERAAVLNKLLSTKDQVKKEKRLNHSQQAALKGFTFGKDYSEQKDLFSKLNNGNEESVTGSQVVEEQEEHSPEPVPQEARSVQSVEIEGEEEAEPGKEQERNIFENTTYQSVYFSSRMRGQGKDVIMEDLDALDKEISKMETENKEEFSNSPPKRQTKSNSTRPQSAASTQNKWSLANSPIKISDNGEIQSAATPVQQKKLSPIKEENKGHRGQRMASKESERTAVQTTSYEEEDVQPYEVLNERGYQGHYEFLHARAMIQKKNKDVVHRKNQQKKAMEELDQCTFTPKTISSPSKKDDIITKTKKWEAEREDKLVRNEMAIIEKEMQTCTFYPNNMLQNAGPGSHSFNNFFQRNTEWQKKKETKNKIREEKVYGSMMTSPKSNKETFIAFCNSKDESPISPIHHTLPTRPTYSSPQNARENKPLKTCCEEKLTSLSSFKKGGHKPTVETVSSPQRKQLGHGKQPSTAKKNITSPKREVDGSELRHDIAHSYKLLQQLKDTVKDTTAAKSKTNRKQLKQQQEEEEIYDDFDFRLRTSGASFIRDSDGFTEHAKRAVNRLESSPQPRLSAPRKIPLSSVEFDPAAFQPGDYLITQQNNKYYIQDNKFKARSPHKTLKNSSSEQTLHSGSPSTAKSPNHSILSNRNSYRDSSAKKNKNVTINTDLNLEYYDSGKGITQVTKSVSKGVETNNKKTKKNSDSLKLHYVAKGIVELPQTTSLDKKYSELINKVHYVSGQLKTLGKGVYMSQI